jgi:hypothetical protein
MNILYQDNGKLIFIRKWTFCEVVLVILGKITKLKLNSVGVVRKRTIPAERLPLVGELIADLCG